MCEVWFVVGGWGPGCAIVCEVGVVLVWFWCVIVAWHVCWLYALSEGVGEGESWEEEGGWKRERENKRVIKRLVVWKEGVGMEL